MSQKVASGSTSKITVCTRSSAIWRRAVSRSAAGKYSELRTRLDITTLFLEGLTISADSWLDGT